MCVSVFFFCEILTKKEGEQIAQLHRNKYTNGC